MKTPKSVTLTANDFDKAISVPWDANTCLVSQTAIRTNITMSDGGSGRVPDPFRIVDCSVAARNAMEIFDKNHRRDTPNQPTSSQRSRALRKLRASLPIRVRLTK